jgi:nucleoside-diphosphate-sugar epimerase
MIHSAGATPALVDALDARQVLDAVARAQPDVIIHELTAIPAQFNLKRFDQEFATTNRLRTQGTDNLLAAARAVSCGRFIIQSYTGWPYARTGGWIKTEEDPLMPVPDPGMRESFDAIRYLESAVLAQSGMQGFVLRYGGFYGPGTSLGEGGTTLKDVRHRRIPVVGGGTAYWSFIHIDDAAAATVSAIHGNLPGIYNITDDEPAPVSEWLPYLAHAVGAKPPRHVPAWLGKLAIGQHGVAMMTTARGASNQKARSALPWKLRWPSWRQGFLKGLGNHERDSSRAA